MLQETLVRWTGIDGSEAFCIADRRSSPAKSPSTNGTSYADAMLDRIVHNAHRINLTGHSLRRARATNPSKD
jgi:hypothetical protein